MCQNLYMDFSRLFHWFVKVVTCFCQSCSMYFSFFAKQNQAEVWPRFQSLLKPLHWNKVFEWVMFSIALGPLCIWQCLYVFIDVILFVFTFKFRFVSKFRCEFYLILSLQSPDPRIKDRIEFAFVIDFVFVFVSKREKPKNGSRLHEIIFLFVFSLVSV